MPMPSEEKLLQGTGTTLRLASAHRRGNGGLRTLTIN